MITINNKEYKYMGAAIKDFIKEGAVETIYALIAKGDLSDHLIRKLWWEIPSEDEWNKVFILLENKYDLSHLFWDSQVKRVRGDIYAK